MHSKPRVYRRAVVQTHQKKPPHLAKVWGPFLFRLNQRLALWRATAC